MDWLTRANLDFAHTHPGELAGRQPVHVVYGGAHLFKADVVRRMGALATRAMADYAPDAAALARAIDIPEEFAETVYTRVLEKLRKEPVEDFRIDFEDGFGARSPRDRQRPQRGRERSPEPQRGGLAAALRAHHQRRRGRRAEEQRRGLGYGSVERPHELQAVLFASEQERRLPKMRRTWHSESRNRSRMGSRRQSPSR